MAKIVLRKIWLTSMICQRGAALDPARPRNSLHHCQRLCADGKRRPHRRLSGQGATQPGDLTPRDSRSHYTSMPCDGPPRSERSRAVERLELLEPVLAFYVLNGAKRLIDLNDLNWVQAM